MSALNWMTPKKSYGFCDAVRLFLIGAARPLWREPVRQSLVSSREQQDRAPSDREGPGQTGCGGGRLAAAFQAVHLRQEAPYFYALPLVKKYLDKHPSSSSIFF